MNALEAIFSKRRFNYKKVLSIPYMEQREKEQEIKLCSSTMQKMKFLTFTSGFERLIYRDMYSSANLKNKETGWAEVMNSFHRNK